MGADEQMLPGGGKIPSSHASPAVRLVPGSPIPRPEDQGISGLNQTTCAAIATPSYSRTNSIR
jgi:hypothetical protein